MLEIFNDISVNKLLIDITDLDWAKRYIEINEYFRIEDTSDYCSFETKWSYILSIPHGKNVITSYSIHYTKLYENYIRVCQ